VTMIDDARHYREQETLVGKDGIVVFFQGEVQGWVNELRNPEHRQPGCVAVDEQGRTWAAIAGIRQLSPSTARHGFVPLRIHGGPRAPDGTFRRYDRLARGKF